MWCAMCLHDMPNSVASWARCMSPQLMSLQSGHGVASSSQAGAYCRSSMIHSARGIKDRVPNLSLLAQPIPPLICYLYTTECNALVAHPGPAPTQIRPELYRCQNKIVPEQRHVIPEQDHIIPNRNISYRKGYISFPSRNIPFPYTHRSLSNTDIPYPTRSILLRTETYHSRTDTYYSRTRTLSVPNRNTPSPHTHIEFPNRSTSPLSRNA